MLPLARQCGCNRREVHLGWVD